MLRTARRSSTMVNAMAINEETRRTSDISPPVNEASEFRRETAIVRVTAMVRGYGFGFAGDGNAASVTDSVGSFTA